MTKRDQSIELWASVCLFTVSAFVYFRIAQRFSKCKSRKHVKGGKISARGETCVTTPAPYLNHFAKSLQDPYDSVRNPAGHIALCVAENRLVLDMIAERLMQVGTTTAAFSNSNVYCYNSFTGMPIAREAAAYFLARRFLFHDYQHHHGDEDDYLSPDEALRNIKPKHVGIGAGVSALMNYLFFVLGDAGDACLIPAPYYTAFETDMQVVAAVVPYSVSQACPAAGPTDEELEVAYARAQMEGHSPRFLLLTNPNSPLGTIYSPDTMLRIVRWARKKGLHTIVDEVYALSTHRRYDHNFQSIIKVLNNNLGDDVHMLWALSKDFGASGLRVGFVYSQNDSLMEAMATLNLFSCVSGPIQYLVSELLTDDLFIDRFLDESRRRIVGSYNICTAKLREMVVPFVPAEAGLFVYVDFSSLLPQRTFECEGKLCDLIHQYAKVVLTPGSNQRDSKPGMFRICYAWISPEILEIAMERLSKLVAKIRRLDWEDLNERSLGNILL